MRRRISTTATILLLGTLAVRALVPLGYMPGNLLDGKFAELCPVASAATFALLAQESSSHHHTHHGTGNDGANYSMDSACPIGTSLLADALPGFDIRIILDADPAVFYRPTATREYLARPPVTYPARAPPHS